MKEKSISINKVYLYSLLPILIGTPAIIIAYQAIYGTQYREILYQNPTLLIYFIVSIPILIILHELIHGLFFALYAESRFKRIKFGIIWKHLTPYCHCEEAIKAKHYGIVLLMPTLLLGVLPFLFGFIIGNFFVVFIGIMMIWSGIGDILAFKLVKEVPSDTLVIDHTDKVGFYYEVFR